MGQTRIYPLYKQAVIDLMAEHPKPGRLITHEWLDEHLGLEKPPPTGRAADLEQYQKDKWGAVGRFRAHLLTTHQKALRVATGGYVVVPPEEQAEFAFAQGDKHIRLGLQKRRQLLTHTNLTALSTDQRAAHFHAMERHARQETYFEQELRLAGPSEEPLSIEDAAAEPGNGD